VVDLAQVKTDRWFWLLYTNESFYKAINRKPVCNFIGETLALIHH